MRFAAGWMRSVEIPELPLARVDWKRSVRVVSSRYPPVGLFDRVADPVDIEAVFAVEALTNNRLRDQAGDISLVPPQERIAGPGTTPIMAAFTHLNRDGSRFSDGSFGVYYAGDCLRTAIAESRFHRQRFLSFSDEPPMRLEMRAYYARINTDIHDLRDCVNQHPEWFDPNPHAYGPAQALARRLRSHGSNGLAYHSVRLPGGECVAIFRPRVVSPVTQGPHLEYIWDGQTITDVLQVRRIGAN